MAYVSSSLASSSGTTSTSYTASLPANEANDLLLLIVNARTTTLQTPTGYTQVVQKSNGTNIGVFYKVSGGSESNPTIQTTGSSAYLSCVALVIKDADTTTPITLSVGTGYQSGNYSAGYSGTSLSLTAGSGGKLLIHALGTDNSTNISNPVGGVILVDRIQNNATLSVVKSYADSSGATPTFSWYCDSNTKTGAMVVVAVNSISNGGREITVSESRSQLMIGGGYGGGITYANGNTISSTINGLAVYAETPSASVVSTPLPFIQEQYINTSTNYGADSWAGYVITVSADLTDAVVVVPWNPFTQWSSARVGAQGACVAFSDGTNWAAYRLRTFANAVQGTDYIRHIDVANETPLDSSGSINWASITKFGIYYHRVAGQTGVPQICHGPITYCVDPQVVVGGASSNPINASNLMKAISQWSATFQKSYLIGYANLQGSGQLFELSGVQFGDGTTETYTKLSTQSFETPAYAVSGIYDWYVSTNKKGITLKASSADTIDFSACVIAANSQQTFAIDAASSTSASYNFSGLSLIGWNVSWLTGIDCTLATFSGCYDVDMKGADLTNCTFTNPQSTNGLKISENGSVIDGCTIDVTGTSAAYHLELGTSVTAITLTDVTFTGTPGTDKVHVLKTSGTVTITIIGTTSLASGDVTSAGATVTISSPPVTQSVVITGLAATYRLQLFDIEYDLTVSGITVTPTAGATYTHNGITWTVRSAAIVAGAGTITVYGAGVPAASGTLTKASGTGDAIVVFSAYAVDGTELYIGVPGATSYTWTDSLAAAAPRVIRVRVMEDGPGTSDAIEMIDGIVGICGITEGAEVVSYLVAAVADDVYNDRGVDGSAITGITIDDTTLRLEIASGTITNYNGTDVLVVDGRDLYAYETYWLGTTAGMRDEARFIEAIDAVNFRCSNFKLKGTSGYPIMINNCFIVDAATGIFSSMVDYSGDPISNHPEHMKAIVVTTSDSVVTGTLSEFIAAVPTASDNANAVWAKTLP